MIPQVSVTHIGTATAILTINGVNFLTDPCFAAAGAHPVTPEISLTTADGPALQPDQLPAIDAVLLSHEDHVDNLDPIGRQLLDGQRVFTTVDGAKNLSPRPAVKGMRPWDEVDATIAGKTFKIIATPCEHLPGGECIGFIVTSPDFGTGRDGLQNAVYFTGDTIYIPELEKMASKYHICAGLFNIGAAFAPSNGQPDGELIQITMDGKQAAKLFRGIKADVLVPMHYDSWAHFTEHGDKLRKAFDEEGLSDKVKWLPLGKELAILP